MTAKLDERMKHLVALVHRERPDLSVAGFHEYLSQRYGRKAPVPSVASIRAVLDERGWVKPPPLADGETLDPPIAGTFAPNDVWCLELLTPVTVTSAGHRFVTVALIDGYSRYLLRLEPVLETPLWWGIDGILRSAYREAGMPRVLRVPPVPPFQTDAPQGLSGLVIWLLRSHLVVDRRPDAPFLRVPFVPPATVEDHVELLRIADAYRKQHNATQVKGFRRSPVVYPGGQGSLVDLREMYVADSKSTDKKGHIRWSGFDLELGPELAKTEINFWHSDWPRFTEVRINAVPLGMLDHLRPERGMIPAPLLPRLSMVYPYVLVDWDTVLAEEAREWLATASSRGARTTSPRPSSRAPKRAASSRGSR